MARRRLGARHSALASSYVGALGVGVIINVGGSARLASAK